MFKMLAIKKKLLKNPSPFGFLCDNPESLNYEPLFSNKTTNYIKNERTHICFFFNLG